MNARPERTRSPVTREANAARADGVVRALLDAGVARFFIAPGSRSTPLVAAASRSSAPCTLFLDERSAGFAAVGAARVGVKSAVITTSGTAVANLLPAMAEADVDELAWVALTADRPSDEVNTGANQTLDQLPLLAGAARASVDLLAPTRVDDDTPAGLAAALTHLEGPGRGPVHVNARFRKPLEPIGGERLTARPRPVAGDAPVDGPLEVDALAGAARGFVVVGALPWRERQAAEELLRALGWPWLADITAGLARGEGAPPLEVPVAALRAAPDLLQPDLVLWLGGRATEPAVATWVKSQDCKCIQVKPGARDRDPDKKSDRVVTAPLRALAPVAAAAKPSALAPLALALAGATPAPPMDLNEPRVAVEVLESLGPGALCFLGNSMPIRDADRFARAVRAPVIANRGASGIDGNLASALGACLASGRPTTALVGDLTFLHDVTALQAAAQARAPLRVVVVNNGGGGIFHFLPIAEHDEVFPWFSTPHEVAAAPLAAALGVRARRVKGLATLRGILSRPPSAPDVVEVITDPKENRALHAALDAIAREAIQAALRG